jgi:hypothetical protein
MKNWSRSDLHTLVWCKTNDQKNEYECNVSYAFTNNAQNIIWRLG